MKNASPAKDSKKKIVDPIDKITFKPSVELWRELLERANGDADLAMTIGKSWLYYEENSKRFK
jgi:hypothetical protein